MGGGVHDSYTFQCGEIFYFHWHRHQIQGTDGFYCLLRKTLARRDKLNCQSPEAKLSAVGFEPVSHRPAAGASQRSHPLGHHAPIEATGATIVTDSDAFMSHRTQPILHKLGNAETIGIS